MSETSPIKGITLTVLLSVLAACATQVVEQPNEITRATMPLGGFNKVVLVKAKIAEDYAGHPANIKAVDKIDEVLALELKKVLNNIIVVSEQEYAGNNYANVASGEVLVIKPLVKQVKFIGGAARFWAGAAAGSSVVVMDTAFIDAGTGTVLSNPGYYRKGAAYGDAFGVASNRMLSDVATDVVNYVRTNK